MTFYRFTVSVVAALSGLIMAQNLVFAQQTGVQDRVLEWPDGTRYEGGVLNGKKEGQGVITWSDGTRLEGNFSNDMLDGPARMILPDGTVLTGSFTGNQLIAEAVDEPVADSEDKLQEQEARDSDEQLLAQEELTEVEDEAELETPLEPHIVEEPEQAPASEDQPLELAEDIVRDIYASPDSADMASPQISSEEDMDRVAETQVLVENHEAIEAIEEPLPAADTSEMEIAEEEFAPAVEIPEIAQELVPVEEIPEVAEEIAVVDEVADTEVEAARRQANEQALNARVDISVGHTQAEDSLNYSDELENEIVAVLDAWASAWSAQNPALYLSFYSDNFQVTDGLSREVWENQRRERIRSPEFIQVDVGYAQFEIVDGNAVEVYLHQGYTSNSYSDFTNKLVTLRREDGLWKILQEVTL